MKFWVWAAIIGGGALIAHHAITTQRQNAQSRTDPNEPYFDSVGNLIDPAREEPTPSTGGAYISELGI